MFLVDFLSNFVSNLISKLASLLFRSKKQKETNIEQGHDKQKNIAGKNVIQKIRTQNIYYQHKHYHYHQYDADPRKIPPSPYEPTTVTGTEDKFIEPSEEEIEAAGDAWIQNQIDQERGK